MTRVCRFVSRRSTLLHSKENDLTSASLKSFASKILYSVKEKHLPGPVFLETKHEREVLGGKFSPYGTIYS